MIMSRSNNIEINKNVKIGYFSQSMDVLDDNLSILDNVMETSVYDENFVRLILARLLFRGDRVYDKVGVISGGEKVKLSFAKIILDDINTLILDEPTNYLDISSLEVIEEMIKHYEGTVILVSHDKDFMENIVDELIIIEDKKLKSFKGGYSEYQDYLTRPKLDVEEKSLIEEKMILDTKLNSVIGRISMEADINIKEELEIEYKNIVNELEKIKAKL